jgi:hypothetical protein
MSLGMLSGGSGGISGGPTDSTATSKGGTFDAQGKYSFGGINTSGAAQTNVAMILVAVVAVAALFLVMRRR